MPPGLERRQETVDQIDVFFIQQSPNGKFSRLSCMGLPAFYLNLGFKGGDDEEACFYVYGIAGCFLRANRAC